MTPPFFGLGPVLGGSASLGSRPLSAAVIAYRTATGISASNAKKVDSLLTKLTTAAGGTAPVFLWLGGSDYNSATNVKTVIGGDLTAVGGHVASPTVNAKSLRTTRTSKFLRGANPTSGDARWTWAVWSEHKDETTDHIILALRNSGASERGPHVYLSPQTPQSTLSSSAAGTGNNVNINPVNAGSRCLIGPSFAGLAYDAADTGATTRVYFNATYENRNLTVYNSHAFVRIGGIDDSLAGGFEYLYSNAEFYAAAAWETDLTEAQLAAVRIALYNAGVQAKHTTVPAMVYLGDSTTGSKWNVEIHSSTVGGAWRNRVAMGAPIGVSPGDMGGQSFAWHYGLQATVIQTLNSLPYEDRYFIYTADSPAGMGPGGTFQDFWDAIGVTVGDADGFYDVMEQWLLDIEAATGCQIVLTSYIQGTTAGAGEDDRNRVAALAAANPSFIFIDLWNEPHNKPATTAYGFYSDTIHQTTAGSQVQAEYITSVLPHPNATSAPRFNIAAPPTITGTQTSGSVLSCSTGTLHVAGTSYTYQWLRNLAAIGGATSSTYTLAAGDVGNRVACRVTAVKSGQPSASFTAAPTGIIA